MDIKLGILLQGKNDRVWEQNAGKGVQNKKGRQSNRKVELHNLIYRLILPGCVIKKDIME